MYLVAFVVFSQLCTLNITDFTVIARKDMNVDISKLTTKCKEFTARFKEKEPFVSGNIVVHCGPWFVVPLLKWKLTIV